MFSLPITRYLLLQKRIPDKDKSIQYRIKDIQTELTFHFNGFFQEFLKNQTEIYGNATSIYAEACAELCLFMCVQSPAFFLDFSTPKGKFDKEKFTVYTKSGDEYAFPVWPPLYLYKEGPMIGKGIAQGS